MRAITVAHWVIFGHFEQFVPELCDLLQHVLFDFIFDLHFIDHLFHVFAVELRKHEELVLHLVELQSFHFD